MNHILVLYMLVIIPMLSTLQYFSLKKDGSTANKQRMYLVTIVLMGIGTIAVALILPAGEVVSFHEQVAIPGFVHLLFGCTIAFLIITFIVPVALVLMQNREFLDKVREQYAPKSFVLPVNIEERRLFLLFALFVGVGEEMMFRSFLARYIHALPFDWSWLVSFLVAALLFGLVHFHQGAGGMFNAFLIGICFSYLFIVTGHLWLPIILHIVYDLKVVLISRSIYRSGDHTKGLDNAGPGQSL